MLARIEKGEAQGILVWHHDRLARNSIDGVKIIYLLNTGKIKDLKFPTFWFDSTPQGKFTLNIAFGQKDLADNQANLILRLPLLLETNGGVAGQLMNMERFNLGLDYLQRYPDLINSLTAADLQQAMQKYWHPQAFNAAIAGPALAENPL